ncbi:hypothetical protein LTS12_027347, partial [Elasticomyces elasticus]
GNLDAPEQFGFLHNQVTPFFIRSLRSESLYAWHIIPIALYYKHELDLRNERPGLVVDVTTRVTFKLLRDDPSSLLVIHFHGAGGNVGSGYRCSNYRVLSAGLPDNIHVLTFDYRGFGRSTGFPSEQGIILDALAVVSWAMTVAQVPAKRILICGQSLGTAVSVAVAEHFVLQDPPVVFAGQILTASLIDASTLASTYSIAGLIPILRPMTMFPTFFRSLQLCIGDKWSSKNCIRSYIRACETGDLHYRITFLHAEDDCDIPWRHTSVLFWHAVLEWEKSTSQINLGSGGSIMEWRTDKGIIREEILKHGLHDAIMNHSTVALAVYRSFGY